MPLKNINLHCVLFLPINLNWLALLLSAYELSLSIADGIPSASNTVVDHD